ncbi:MAG: hemerythrin family protein [Candidatus Accumulibacter sp.]|jgi:hemerythrin|nr:hemerythrin family protein [Accumulibacter sp.]MBK8384684.1 hemerythrin family protein [Accumulibacter sp.]MBK8578629.1 hemerythrin family protein [Candidatus Accumulibacter propinquus]MBN8436787.1 hemerythrin family protein [Accumulibacter sp.]
MEINRAGMLPEALLIDLPEIDAQHEEIFRRIETLKAVCFASGPLPFEDFDQLLAYLKCHFATEERVATENGADFADHAAVHRENLQALQRAFDEVRDGARDVHSYLRYAEYWFERHIAEEDKPFAARVRERRLTASARSQSAASEFSAVRL